MLVSYSNKKLGRIAYEDTEFKINAVGYLKYIGRSDKPTQPIGLKDYSFMFYCNHHKTLDLSDWDMSEAEYLNSMFEGCLLLNSIDGLEKLVTSRTLMITKIFRGCGVFLNYNLEDISKWDISGLTDIDGVFAGCTYINDFSILDNWDMKDKDSLIGSEGIFASIKHITKYPKWYDVENETISEYRGEIIMRTGRTGMGMNGV